VVSEVKSSFLIIKVGGPEALVRCPFCEEPAYLLLSSQVHLADGGKVEEPQSRQLSPQHRMITDVTQLAE
jgi:hypothetical protein